MEQRLALALVPAAGTASMAVRCACASIPPPCRGLLSCLAPSLPWLPNCPVQRWRSWRRRRPRDPQGELQALLDLLEPVRAPGTLP